MEFILVNKAFIPDDTTLFQFVDKLLHETSGQQLADKKIKAGTRLSLKLEVEPPLDALEVANRQIAELTKQATAKNLAIDYLLEKIKSLDANYGLEVVRVNCPFCSFLGSSHGSMVVHFGNNHYEQMKDCPKPHQWVPAMEKKS